MTSKTVSFFRRLGTSVAIVGALLAEPSAAHRASATDFNQTPRLADATPSIFHHWANVAVADADPSIFHHWPNVAVADADPSIFHHWAGVAVADADPSIFHHWAGVAAV